MFHHLKGLRALLFAGVFFCVASNLNDKFIDDKIKLLDTYIDTAYSDREKYIESITRVWDVIDTSMIDTWVSYGPDFTEKVNVDFKKGEVSIEILSNDGEKKIIDKLSKLVKRTNDTEDAKGNKILKDQILTKSGKTITNSNLDKEISEIKIEKKSTILGRDKIERVRYQAILPLRKDHLSQRAKKYFPLAKKYAKKFDLPTELIMAVMEVESNFNPFAKSSSNAIGLMQVVPTSGGADSYNYIYGKEKIVSDLYLFDPNNNVLLGSGYLAKLKTVTFKKLNNDQSRLYSIIASYNTGAGNLSRAINGNKNIERAIVEINNFESSEFLAKLKRDLPYTETKDYIVKVLKAMGKY